MTNGTYGTNRPASITSDDVDIFYYYRPTRSSESSDFDGFKRLDSSNLLNVTAEGNDSITRTLNGMYNLRLPLDVFGEAGIYTVYIKPKEIFTYIADVSTLAAYSNVRGVVLNAAAIDTDDNTIFNNGGLEGYRIDYLDSTTSAYTGMYRIITSSNRCEPLNVSLSDSTQKGVRYRFNDSSNLIFCTVSPSTAMSFKSSSLPSIGTTSQPIVLSNTKFNPIMLEIEMTEHDIETVSTMLEGKQLRNLDYGLITTFNKDGEIYHQATYGNITNTSEGINHDFKIPNTDNITNSEIDNLQKIEDNL